MKFPFSENLYGILRQCAFKFPVSKIKEIKVMDPELCIVAVLLRRFADVYG